MSELIIGIRYVGRNIDEFQGIDEGFSIGKRNQEGRMLLEFCEARNICITNTWFGKADKTYGSGYNKSKIDFFIMGKVDCKFLKNVRVITGELQHNLVAVDVDKKQKKKTEWKLDGQKRNVAELRDEPCRQFFKCRVKEIMSDNNYDFLGLLMTVF